MLEVKANGDVLCLYVTPLDFKLRTNNQLPATTQFEREQKGTQLCF